MGQQASQLREREREGWSECGRWDLTWNITLVSTSTRSNVMVAKGDDGPWPMAYPPQTGSASVKDDTQKQHNNSPLQEISPLMS
jgi:hypothetical protein